MYRIINLIKGVFLLILMNLSSISYALAPGTYDVNFDGDGILLSASTENKNLWGIVPNGSSTEVVKLSANTSYNEWTDTGAENNLYISRYNIHGQLTGTQTFSFPFKLTNLVLKITDDGNIFVLATKPSSDNLYLTQGKLIKFKKNNYSFELDTDFGVSGVVSFGPSSQTMGSTVSADILVESNSVFVSGWIMKFSPTSPSQAVYTNKNYIWKISKNTGQIIARNEIVNIDLRPELRKLDIADDGQLLASIRETQNGRTKILKISFNDNDILPNATTNLYYSSGTYSSNAMTAVGMDGDIFLRSNIASLSKINSTDALQTPSIVIPSNAYSLAQIGQIDIQPDNKLLVVGTKGTLFNGNPAPGSKFIHFRLNTNHSLDQSFGFSSFTELPDLDQAWSSGSNVCLGVSNKDTKIFAFGRGQSLVKDEKNSIATRLNVEEWDTKPNQYEMGEKIVSPSAWAWSEWVKIDGLSAGVKVSAIVRGLGAAEGAATISKKTPGLPSVQSPYRVWVQNGDFIRVRIQAPPNQESTRRASVVVGGPIRTCMDGEVNSETVRSVFTVHATGR